MQSENDDGKDKAGKGGYRHGFKGGTKTIRVPVELIPDVRQMIKDYDAMLKDSESND